MASSKARAVDTGITCLHAGGDNPKADLVFVHGLGGHPQKTWSTEPCEPKALAERKIPIGKRITKVLRLSRRKTGSSKKGKTSTDGLAATEQPQPNRDAAGNDKRPSRTSESPVDQEVFWPRDLLPEDVKDVRVMTFGYYSNPGDSSQDNLYTLSKNLLGKLTNERACAPNRPIIFVAHSLGGILTKFALKISQDSTGADAPLKTIRDSTKGVIFFGTPHSGSDMASLGELLRRIAGIFAVTNSTLLSPLDSKSDNGQLEELSGNFVRMLGPSSEGKFQVFSFRETKPLVNGPLGPVANLVVPLNSSKIDSEWAGFSTVPDNHRDICKFGGPKDPKYTDFVKELQRRFLDEIGEKARLKVNHHYAVPIETVQSYTERYDLWKDLEEKLQIRHRKASVPYAVALHGLGGVGKSQLALKYAESQKDRYNPVLWIDATDEEAVRSSFRRCAAELGLPDDQDDKQTSALADNRALQRVLRWLRDRKETDDEWLAIVDNADDVSWEIKEAMPKGARGSIIITSQDNRSHMLVPGGCERVEVGVMSPQEGTTLLLQRLDLHNEAATETVRTLCAKVADELGHLPLAIDLAGAYIGNDFAPHEVALRQYLEDLTTHRDELLQKDEYRGLMATKKTVWTVWDTTLQRITKDTVQPRLLLRFLAQFKGTIIQDEMFRLAALGTSLLDDGLVEDRLADDVSVQLRRFLPVKGGKWDSFLYRQCRDLLVRYGLLQRVGGDWAGVTMHKLVQWRAVQSEGSEPWVWRHMVHILAACCQVTEAKHHPEFRRHLVVHLPDVSTAFSAVSGNIEMHRDFIGRTIGKVYYDEGRWEEAEKLFVQVMETRKTKLGADHPDTLTSMANLASTYRNQGRWEEAKNLFVQVMETRKTKLGADHPDTLTSMANLALTYRNQGRWKEAEDLFEQVMGAHRTNLGADHPDTLTGMGNLALTYRDQGQWKKAEVLEMQVMQTRKSQLGTDHPDTLDSMANLASTYWNQGRWEEAENLFKQVTETRETKIGTDHPDTLTSKANLASTYWNQGRWKEAEDLLVQVIEPRKTKLGDYHPDTLASMGNLASTYRYQGRWEEAEKIELYVMESRKTKLGADHPDTLAGMANLASTYWNQGRLGEAEKLIAQVTETRKTKLGADHPSTLTSMSNLAATYRNQGRWEEAETLGRQVMETRKAKLGADHPDTLWSINNLASMHRDQGRWKEAETLGRQVMETRKAKLGSDHPDTLTSMANLAFTWKKMGRYGDALCLIQTCLTLRRQVLGPEHPHTASTLQDLIEWQKESESLAQEG